MRRNLLHIVSFCFLIVLSDFVLAGESGYIVFVSSDDNQLYSVIDEEVKQQTFNPFALSADPAWSPDGKYIVYSAHPIHRGVVIHERQIFIKPTDDKEIVQLTFDGSNSQPIWSPDGKKLAYICIQDQGIRRGPQVCIFDLETQTEEIPTFEPSFPKMVQWAPPFGRRYVVAARPPLSSIDRLYGIFIIDRNGMNNRLLLSRKNLNKTLGGLSWYPDEQAIMFADENEKLFVLDVNTGHRQL